MHLNLLQKYTRLTHMQDVKDRSIPPCFYEKVSWKYAVNLQGSTHVEVWILLKIRCIFSEHLFIRISVEVCLKT